MKTAARSSTKGVASEEKDGQSDDSDDWGQWRSRPVAQPPPDMLDAKQGSSGAGERPIQEEESGTSRNRAGVGRKFKADAKKGKGYGTLKAHRHKSVSAEHRRCEAEALAADVPLEQIKGAPANVPDEEEAWAAPDEEEAWAALRQETEGWAALRKEVKEEWTDEEQV